MIFRNAAGPSSTHAPVHQAPHLAQEFGGDADVAGDLGLGEALGDLGVVAEEGIVALFGGVGDGGVPAGLEGDEGVLEEAAEEALEAGEAVEEFGFGAVVEEEEFGVLEGFDEGGGGGLVAEALEIGDPAAFDGKGEVGLYAAGVAVEDADATPGDKGLEITDIPFLEQKAAFPQPAEFKQLVKAAAFFLGKRNNRGDGVVDCSEHRHPFEGEEMCVCKAIGCAGEYVI